MYCKKCGQQLEDGSNFCPKCGTNQNEAVTQSSEQTAPQAAYEEKPKKPLKKPSTSVILNLIASFSMIFIGELVFGFLVSDSPSKYCGSFLFNICILLPLVLSVAVLLVKNNTVKWLFSIAELIVSASVVIYCWYYWIDVPARVEVYWFLFMPFFSFLIIFAALRNLSYSRKLQYYTNTVPVNKDKNKKLAVTSSVVVVIAVILSATLFPPYAKINKLFISFNEESTTIEQKEAMIEELNNKKRESENYSKGISNRAAEEAKMAISGKRYTDANMFYELIDDENEFRRLRLEEFKRKYS